MDHSAKELLTKSPLAIVVSDSNEKIVSCNSRFCDYFGLTEDSVIGQLYPSLPIEAIDKAASRVQLFSEEEAISEKFQYWTAPLESGDKAHYFAPERNNRNPVKQIGGAKLPKRASWVDFLDYEVSRSRRYDNPLAILKLHLVVHNQPDNINPTTLNETINDTLMNELRWADMIGHTDEGSYLMVLPETPTSALNVLKDKIHKALLQQIGFISTEITFSLVFGESCWQKRDDSKRMLKRARDNLVEQLEKLIEDKS